MTGPRYRRFLAAVPRHLVGGVLTGETTEHVQVLVQRDQVMVHQPAHALERFDPGLAQIARNRPGLSGTPAERVERGDSPVFGQDSARHRQMIGARPAFHQQCRNYVAGGMRAPLASEGLTVSLLIRWRARGPPLVQVDQPDQALSDLAQAAQRSANESEDMG
jgi:hypothetical protein